MHTQRTWLLVGLMSFLAVLPVARAAGDDPLVTAARDGDLQAVRGLIAKRAKVNEPARDGSTALLWAAYHADVQMTQALLAAGASVNAANRYGITPLLQASRTGDAAVIDALLKAGADSKITHPDGETPLMAASRAGSLPAVKLLLEAGSDANAVDSYQEETALMWAAGEGHADIIKALLAAGADANRKGRITTISERKHADHPSGGFTALMFAVRNGHTEAVKALVAGGADTSVTNGDGATALIVAVINDRFDLAATLLDLGASANDGALYFAADMHDATTDMRARDGSRLRADHPNKLGALDLVRRLLERGADPNKAFVGQLHSTTLCCDAEINASPFYRAAVASDVEVLKLMIAHGAEVEWSPSEVKKEGAGGGRGNANVGRTPIMVTMNGGRGAAFAAGPGFERLGPPPFREPAVREPVEAIKVLLAAGANPNAKAPDGATPLHQAVTARQVPIIRALVSAGAKLDATNKDNLTPLQLAEKPEPAGRGVAPVNTDPNQYRPKRDTREDVVAALRELMGLGPNDRPPSRHPSPRLSRRRPRRPNPRRKRPHEASGRQRGAGLDRRRDPAGTGPGTSSGHAAARAGSRGAVWGGVGAAQSGAVTAAAASAKHRAWLKQYCVACHNERNPLPANDPLKLDSVNLDDVTADAAMWERVLRKLSVRAMPPQGSPHPSEPEYVAFTTWLSDSLDRGWAARATPGRFVVHRLNRAEYRNAVRDLLALDVDVSAVLPNDGGDFGFDNIAAALTTSPLLLDGYLTAAQRLSTLAVGDAAAHTTTAEYSINRDVSQSGHVDGLPLGTRGGKMVRHVFPADGEYKLFGRLVRGIEEGYAGVEGHDRPHTFVITVDGEEVFAADIGGQKDHDVQAKDMNEARAIIDARMTATVKVTAGPHDLGFTFRERPFQQQDVWQPSQRDSQEIHMIGGLPKLKTVGVEGPYKVTGVAMTPSRERIFICQPAAAAEEARCASRIVTTLAQRAYRRPVTGEDTAAPLAFYTSARERGATFDAGIRAAVARILASPLFLYRIERDPAGVRAGTARRVSDIELASRLSFFLWSSIPDDRLMTLATAGRLRAPGVLAGEVRRLIADKRADALVGNFAGQWLQLRNLESKVRPDILAFPDFDDNVREAFRRETELLFAHIMRGNRSALELLSADYTFVNERLARHYGIPGVYGSRFRQVKLTDPNRRGLLGHGSILSMTSVATRTSPVYRGKFILSTFLNTPPPPPLPDVPTLEESTKDHASAPKTVRAQLELHRSSPVCAQCHRVIDPPGFALERFNPIGQWRETMPDGAAIDTGGVMADGTKVDGPAALRESILSRPEAFTTVLAERLLTYALGRGVEPSDMPVVRKIVKQAARSGYRFESIITGIVESAPFQMRTTLESPGTGPSNRIASVR